MVCGHLGCLGGVGWGSGLPLFLQTLGRDPLNPVPCAWPPASSVLGMSQLLAQLASLEAEDGSGGVHSQSGPGSCIHGVIGDVLTAGRRLCGWVETPPAPSLCLALG